MAGMSVRIRTAETADAPILSRLLADLGYAQNPTDLAEWIAGMADGSADAVLVAEVGGAAVGVVSLHVTPFFNLGRRRGRITAFVVDAEHRGRGVGRRLLEAVETAAEQRGCYAMEVTSAAHRDGAHRFYAAAGYENRPHRFLKPLRDDGGSAHPVR
jgi:GNAT superfamily N-acetyltransferase